MKKIEINGYVVNIDYSKELYDQNLLEETMIILSILYRDYLCDDDEKNEIIESDKRELELRQKEMEEKYSIKWGKNENKETIVENIQVIEYQKQNIIQKIISKILKFIKRK